MILSISKEEQIGADASSKSLTIEIQTPFDESVTEASVIEYVKKELPISYARSGQKISYLLLVSFNSKMGRLHRLFVSFPNKSMKIDRTRFDRILPLSLIFNAYAEEKMIAGILSENSIVCGLLQGNFYFLFYLNARLVHWIEEECIEFESISERIKGLKSFCKKDFLLSPLSDVEVLLIPILSKEEIQYFFDTAVKDPLWANFDLDQSIYIKERLLKRLVTKIKFLSAFIVFLLIIFSVFHGILNENQKKQEIWIQAKKKEYELLESNYLDFQNDLLSVASVVFFEEVLKTVYKAIGETSKIEFIQKKNSELSEHYIFKMFHPDFINKKEIERKLRKEIKNLKEVKIGGVEKISEDKVHFILELYL